VAESANPSGGHVPAETSTSGPPATRGQDSLTQLLARILNQLSVSAWLPAGALVFIVLLYGNLRNHQNDLIGALRTISSMGWGSLIVAVGAVVLVTMLTQAFEFEAIRMLEGYWGGGWVGARLGNLGCRFQVYRRRRLHDKRERLTKAAFERALTTMKSDKHLYPIVGILEADVYHRALPPSVPKAEVERARQIGWYNQARPGDIRRIDEIRRRLRDDFPTDRHRVLPTRLGNVLRAFEDQIYKPGSGLLEGMVQRVYHRLPSHLQGDHDQVRSRLDLYCTMFLIFVLTAFIAFPVIGWTDWRDSTVAIAISLSLAFMSYRAAVASARAYGVVLETIAMVVERSSNAEGS
jgi:hypothetical protein